MLFFCCVIVNLIVGLKEKRTILDGPFSTINNCRMVFSWNYIFNHGHYKQQHHVRRNQDHLVRFLLLVLLLISRDKEVYSR